MPAHVWSGGEGCGLTTETAGAPLTWEEALIHQFGAKTRGTQPTSSYGYLRPSMDAVEEKKPKKSHQTCPARWHLLVQRQMLHGW